MKLNFNKGAWLGAFFQERSGTPLAVALPEWQKFGLDDSQIAQFRSTREPFYNMLLSSGLIYGFPVDYPFLPDLPDSMTGIRRVKVILLDIMLKSVPQDSRDAGWESHVTRVGESIKGYYRLLHKVVGEEEAYSIEEILFERVAFKKSFWDFRSSGVNSHLFWDCYCFRIWHEKVSAGAGEKQVIEEIIDLKRTMKMLTLRIMAAAMHSDGEIRKGEKVLQSHFKRSSRLLTKGQKAQAHRILKEGIGLEDFGIPFIQSWTARRYLLDIAVLAVSADKEIVEAENAFLQALVEKLGLSKPDLVESKADLSCFLLQYGKSLHFYSNRKSSFSLMGQAIRDNTRELTYAAGMEYQETRDMALTIGALLKNQLGKDNPEDLPSEDEIIYALEQLKDIPRFLPFLSMVFIPVPGITELYILLAYSIERMTGDKIQLLPSQFSKMVKKK